MDRQKVYDKVKEHLLKQNAKSVREDGTCMYRGPNGLKCAIGALIPDEIYSKGLEGVSVDAFVNKYYYKVKQYFDKEYGLLNSEDWLFMIELQRLHDSPHSYPERWEDSLKACAFNWNLTP